MSAPVWQPATIYLPGALVTPRTTNIVVQEQPYNNSFESGLTHWAITGEYCTNLQAQTATSSSSIAAYDGSYSAQVGAQAGNGSGPYSYNPPGGGDPAAVVVLTNAFQAPVTPGQKINFSARFFGIIGNATTHFQFGGCAIAWYDASHAFLSYSVSSHRDNPNFIDVLVNPPALYSKLDGAMDWGLRDQWYKVSGVGVAPPGAAYAAAVICMSTTAASDVPQYCDYFQWDYTQQGYPTGLVFVATQSGSGTSAGVEPVWPTTSGLTVVDGSVTWEAEFASVVTWTASPILESGATEPTWPTTVGGVINDNTIEWTATDGRITDPNCPNSTVVAIASAKVYVADNDIIRFSATANAQDWSSSQDAGFIPFGLQSFGNEPCAGLGLYRSNLVAFNSLGYQMWQVDPDPNNIAILDAEPVGCIYPKSIQPVNNDLVFLTQVGIRNIGTAGASGNLQAGQFGKQVDPIVKALITQLSTSGYEVRSLFYPGAGQYWLIFGPQAIVLSINGNNTMSWSRYEFPAPITDWTIGNGNLYLRAGDLIWEVSESTLLDDVFLNSTEGGTNTGYQGYAAWNYIECGELGVEKQMEGFDLTIGNIDDSGEIVTNNNITCEVSIGYNQSDRSQATDPYTLTGDTIPGTMVPIPITAPSFQMRLNFGTGQNWGWGAMNLYVKPVVKP